MVLETASLEGTELSLHRQAREPKWGRSCTPPEQLVSGDVARAEISIW